MTIKTKDQFYWRLDTSDFTFEIGIHRLAPEINRMRVGRSPVYATEAEARAGLIAEMKRIHASITAQIEYLEKLK